MQKGSAATLGRWAAPQVAEDVRGRGGVQVLPSAARSRREVRRMIARTWKGAVRSEDGDEYAEYIRKTGIPGYTQTPGNLATLMLRRDVADRCEFLMFTLWDSIESVKAFAGRDPEKAIFYPEDDAFLIGRDLTSLH